MEERRIRVSANIKLYPWQQDTVFGIEQNWKRSIHVVKSMRQVGKSTLLTLLLIRTAVERNKTVSICLSPTLDQARKLYRSIKNILQPTKLYRRHNDLNLVIETKNSSEIYFKSAEQGDNLRGYTVTGIYVVDEASFIKDDIFYSTLPYVNVSGAPIVIVSTPLYRQGFFYKYYCLGLENGNRVFSYDWSSYDTSALLPPEKLEEYRHSLPPQTFKSEYLGQFLDADGGVFGNFSAVLNNNYNKENQLLYMGIDWGSGQGQDSTAIAIFNSDREMVKLFHFNDKDETQTIDYIVGLIKEYRPLKVLCESNSIGTVFYGLLDKAIKAEALPVMLLKFTTTNESKERIINSLIVYIQNKQVQLLDDPELVIEMEMYQMKVTSNGHRVYNAASNFHDDCVIATMLGIEAITKGTYNIV